MYEFEAGLCSEGAGRGYKGAVALTKLDLGRSLRQDSVMKIQESG